MTSKKLGRFAAIFFLVPLIGLAIEIAINNKNSYYEVLYIYGYIVVFSGGLPIWKFLASYRVWTGDWRGYKSMSRISLIMIGILLVAFGSQFIFPEMICSETGGKCQSTSLPRSIAFTLMLILIYLDTWFVGENNKK